MPLDMCHYPTLAKGEDLTPGVGRLCSSSSDCQKSLLQNCFYVILNEVKDLNLLKIRDSSLRSE